MMPEEKQKDNWQPLKILQQPLLCLPPRKKTIRKKTRKSVETIRVQNLSAVLDGYTHKTLSRQAG